MKIAHVSDLHGHYEILDCVREVPDVWVFTGDIFPYMKADHHPFWGQPAFETPHQTRWYGYKADSIVRRLRGAPVLLVPGNHDFADLAALLRRDGVDAREVTPRGLDFGGLRFAGFGHIPYIAGRWNREASGSELRDLVVETLDVGNPDILLTHSPPGGILCGGYPGIDSLVTALTYRPNRVAAHLFGHAHEDGGKTISHMGITFVNSATTALLVEV